MMRYCLFSLLLVAAVICFSCNRAAHEPVSDFVYPANKVWAHEVDDTLVAQQKAAHFDGLELNLNYSAHQDELFVGHELCDTIDGLTLEEWFSAMPHPQKHWYWIDMKNLDKHNAQDIAERILEVAEQFGVKERMMVEHTNDVLLKVLKEAGLYVMLWVENSYWTGTPDDEWHASTKEQIRRLRPDALSCEYRMYPLLPDSFSYHNIHLWQTPMEHSEENAEFTRELCRHPAVKVVLVDYDHPIAH